MRGSALGLSAGIAAVVVSGLVACSAGAPDDGASSTSRVTTAAPSTVNVLSSKNDLNRTGHNAEEPYLTTSNVRSATFGRLFSRPIDGNAYAQPLYASNVGGKNLVFVATEHNTIYAFDADDTSANAAPVWSKNLGPSLPSSQTGCGLLSPEIGITGTPVIDLQAKTIWFTSRHLENGKAVHKLNALDIATGDHRPGSPVVITAQAKGTGSTSVNGVITFDPLKQMQRPGILKVGNEIVIGFGSQCDSGPYHGWLLGYDATTLQQNRVHITTPNGGEGSIWNGGVGINADEKGDIYFPAADAYDQSNTGAAWNGADNEADSLVHLHDDGSKWVVVSKFTTFDAPTYSPQDRSFGNGGGILLPGTNLYVAGDKRGQMFAVDRDDMGGMVDQDANVVQKWQAAKDLGTPGGGAYLQTGGASGVYYAWGTGDTLKAWKFDGAKFDTAALTNATSSTGYPGGALSLSSNHGAPGSAILWAVKSKRTSAGLAASEGAGALVAFDALDVTKVLYSSDEVASDALGNATKFAPPTIANGKVFVGTSSNQLVVYGLRSGNPPPPADIDAGPAPAPDAGPTPADAGPSTATWATIYGDLFGPNTPGHCGNSGCHQALKGGFKCGSTADDCYSGMVAAGFLTPNDPTHSPIIDPNDSPLAWFNGGMPMDNPDPNDAAAAELSAWIQAGAPK